MKVAVIVPTHNEPNTEAVVDQIEAVISDGDMITVFNDGEGRGKGYALREALRYATADYYIFIDGDGDIDPYQIQAIVLLLDRGCWDIVVGKKELPHRWDRKLLTFASRLWVKLLFGLTVDSQTGLKGFSYKPQFTTDGWACDMEILYKAKKMGKTMMEIPVHATVSSGKSARDIFSTLKDTIKIRLGL